VNLVERLRSQFETYGDSRTFTFLHESGRTLVEDVVAFRDLDRGAREVAAWLSSRPEATQPVLLLFEPGLGFWRAFLGCLYAGVIAIPAPLPTAPAPRPATSTPRRPAMRGNPVGAGVHVHRFPPQERHQCQPRLAREVNRQR
jgi:acyl-CoA synthetase (AMP-forming)/AMP-acid ligase II